MSLRSRLNRVARKLGAEGQRRCRCKDARPPFAVWFEDHGQSQPVVEDAICEQCGGILEAVIVCVRYDRPPLPGEEEVELPREKPDGPVKQRKRRHHGSI